MSGKITLYDFDGTEVASASYEGPKNRSERLSTWKHRVGYKRYEKMFYHVIPDTRPELVSKNGANTNRIPNIQKNAKLFDIKRPKAKYDNKKTLY